MSNIVPVRKPILRETDGVVLADSRDIAAFFDKRHDHVLDAIDKLYAHSREFGGEFFKEKPFPHPTVAGRVDVQENGRWVPEPKDPTA